MRVSKTDQVVDPGSIARGTKKQALGGPDQGFNDLLAQLVEMDEWFPGLANPLDEEGLAQGEKDQDQPTLTDDQPDTMIVQGMMVGDGRAKDFSTVLGMKATTGQEDYIGDYIDKPKVGGVDLLGGPGKPMGDFDPIANTLIQNKMTSSDHLSASDQEASILLETPLGRPVQAVDQQESTGAMEGKLAGQEPAGQEPAGHKRTLETVMDGRPGQAKAWHGIPGNNQPKGIDESVEPLVPDLSTGLQTGDRQESSASPPGHTGLGDQVGQGARAENLGQPMAEDFGQPMAENLGQPMAEDFGQPMAEDLGQAMADDSLRQATDGEETSLQTHFMQESYEVTGTDSPQAQATAIDNLAEIGSMMAEKISSLKTGDSLELKVSLEPERLGKLEIRVRSSGGNLLGEIFVDSIAAREAMENGIRDLKDRLMEQNIQLEQISISLKQDSSGGKQMGQGLPGNKEWADNTRFAPGKQDIKVPNGSLIGSQYVRGMGNSLNLLI
ncbi:MAG TPA: flagellar hook-length control protein FliK [Bacillota bacterium]|nr:flagellar hook-length control protein FliK [Bacillota bacterium]